MAKWLTVFRMAIAMIALGTPALRAAEAERWNVVLVLVDDLGWTDFGCYGSDLYETPHIDRLARDGMRFTAAYSACTVCSPTRASLRGCSCPTGPNISRSRR